ncbi:probable histidine kinase 2 [Lolium rigidum]|uniref:probable histidine kinase 2 n=1 Tax=Lolium rigidum TaxID=89674 RepID=UPI001F5D92C2|nr:probable histidine kinase 2 [Lolium rigidum]
MTNEYCLRCSDRGFFDKLARVGAAHADGKYKDCTALACFIDCNHSLVVAHGATILVVALAYISISRHVKEATSAAVSSNMYASLDHVAIGMQAILAANHSAFVVADNLAATSNMNRLSRVEQNLFMAFAMQPHVAEMSYTSIDGSSFTYYRGKDSRPSLQGLRLVWQKEAMFPEIGVAVVSVVCLLALMVVVACFFMARALWRSGSREAALQGELMRQKEALQQAERKSMNKSNAFASAIHDIRSSLAAVAGLIDVSRTEARANPNLTYYLDQMKIGTNKLFDILNTILDMGKVESGKMQLEEVQFSMADVLEESMDMANVVGMSRGIEVIWDPCDFSVLRCDVVIGDCKRFKQILDNLLGNAIKFTHDGHIVLRAWANRPIARTSMINTPSRFAPRWCASVFYRWLLGTREEGAEQNARRSLLQNDPNAIEFYFEVVDTGVGIPKEKRESVFENYVQVKEGHGGTGLGLGIVQSIVRLMGGEISIKDKEPGEAGTCFGLNVFLKISDAEEHIEHGRAVPSLFREPGCFKGGQCVLLVHGDETRRILHSWMENVGMKVWPVPRAELLAQTMEKARAAVGASPSRPASISSSQGGGDDLDGVADRCFSSKEMVTQVLRNSSGSHVGHLHPFGLLVVVDISGGRLNEILQEAPSLARIKHQVPCRVACITDLKTSSEDLRRLKEAASCDMDLRKPIHGSRLRQLLQVMRELQASPFPQQLPHQVGVTINELPTADQATAASSEITSAATAASSETTSAAAVPQELPKLEDDRPLEGKRVLLVEDTRVLQFIQKKMLSTLGATVMVAADGSEAVAMFINALEIASGGASSEERLVLPYDVIFMDCQMPVMDGYEATKGIRREESRYGIHTPIIALTAHSEEEYLQKTIQAGMDLHLTKPIQKEQLVEVVHQVWKEHN